MKKSYFKILREDEIHNGLKFKTGRNEDPNAADLRSTPSCAAGAIYYVSADHITDWMRVGPWIREVTLPRGRHHVEDPGGGKYRSHCVILGVKKPWAELKTMKWLVEKGAKNLDACAQYAARAGHLDTVRWLVEKGAKNLDACAHEAARAGHWDTVRWLVEKGAKNLDACAQEAARAGHWDTVRWLKDKLASGS